MLSSNSPEDWGHCTTLFRTGKSILLRGRGLTIFSSFNVFQKKFRRLVDLKAKAKVKECSLLRSASTFSNSTLSHELRSHHCSEVWCAIVTTAGAAKMLSRLRSPRNSTMVALFLTAKQFWQRTLQHAHSVYSSTPFLAPYKPDRNVGIHKGYGTGRNSKYSHNIIQDTKRLIYFNLYNIYNMCVIVYNDKIQERSTWGSPTNNRLSLSRAKMHDSPKKINLRYSEYVQKLGSR